MVLRLNESGFRLPAHVETMIYRLLLDILGDARLAPGATSVDVTLDVAPPQVFLQVHHDGATSLRAEDFREHPMTALGADILVEPHSPAGVVVQMHLRQRPYGRCQAPHPGEDPPAFMSINDIPVVIIDDHTLVRAGIARLIDSETGPDRRR